MRLERLLHLDPCRTTLRAVAVALLLLAPAATALADDAHYQFDLSVDGPASTGDSFRVQVTETLVGAKPAVKVSIVYEIVVVDPSGAERVLQGPVSETNGLGAELQHITIRYWPRQNGEFLFRVVQLDGAKQTVLAERRLPTDKVPVLALDAPPTTPQSGGEFAVTGLRTDPVQPVAGEPVNVLVDAANSGAESVTQTVPVLFVDDTGQQLLATGSFTLVPGSSGTGQVTWIPQHATTGLLEAGNQSVPITVIDGPAAAPADPSDQVSPPDSPPDE
jgi:hypothetical protein